MKCSYNSFTSLDVSNNTGLGALYCESTQLTSLDVTKNIALWSLRLDNNQLTALDVSNNTNLRNLYCEKNQLTSLDISINSNLKKISLGSMGSLNQVCVWEIPFPPDGVDVDTTGSPNVYFTTDCN